MKAGRELDALIAEKVMGWKLIVDYDTYNNLDAWVNEGGQMQEFVMFWSPSEYIKNAWLVVDKLGEMGWYVTLFRTRCYWKVVLGHYPYEAVPEIKKHNPETHEGIGPYIEAPLAICLAALKAVE